MERKKERRIGTRIEIHIYTIYIVNKYVQKHMLASMRTYILRMYGWMDGWMDGWVDRWMYKHADTFHLQV